MFILFSSNQTSQLLRKDNRIHQSNSSSSAVVAGFPSKFSDQSQKEVFVDPMMIFRAENYKYSAIYAHSDDFNTKISEWKQRSSSIKGVDLKLLVGLTYIDHLQREILRCSKNLTEHKKLGWHTVSSLKSSMKNIRIYLKQLNTYTIEFTDVGKRCLVNCYYSNEESKEVVREVKEKLQQLVEIRNTITESYKELDDINWKIEYISSQHSGTLDRVMLVTSQLPKICHNFFLLVLKNADTIFSNDININSKNSATVEDQKMSSDNCTDTTLRTSISDINKEKNDIVPEDSSLGKPNSEAECNAVLTSVNNNPEQLYTGKSAADHDTKNSLECAESSSRELSSDDVTDNSDLIRKIFDERAPEFQQKFQNLGEEFKILVKCIRDQEGVNVMLEKGKKIIIGAHSIIFVADFCNDHLPDCEVKQELQNRVTKLVDAITTFASATKKASASYPSTDSLQRMVKASKDLSTVSKELVVYAASLTTK